MAKLNVVTLLAADRPFDDALLSLVDQFEPFPAPELNRKLVCDTKLDDACLKATIKWAQEETQLTRVDPMFKHLIPESRTQIKTFEVRTWLWRNTPIALVFTDSRTKIHEVQDGLRQILGIATRRITLSHEALRSLLSTSAVMNVYELEFKDSNALSSISTITFSGHSLLDSDLFRQVVGEGQSLSRLKVEFRDPKGVSFLATINSAGLVVLSPYVSEPQVGSFVETFIPCILEGLHEA